MPTTYEPIATTTLGSAQATVSFASIPATYTDLVFIVHAKNDTTSAASNLRFNDDTATNYSYTALEGNGSTAGSYRDSNVGANWGGSYYTNNHSTTIINIQNYANTTTNKTFLMRTNEASRFTAATVGLWRSTAAINKITINIGGNWAAGSTFTLYGIKAA